tara:strand:+ start:374 stop:565 length:192 start_codon:yes stop_codon:yes gene_type:complete
MPTSDFSMKPLSSGANGSQATKPKGKNILIESGKIVKIGTNGIKNTQKNTIIAIFPTKTTKTK